MPLIRESELRRGLEAATRDRTPYRFYEDLWSGFRNKQINPADYSVRRLFEQLVPDGRQVIESWDIRNANAGINLLEAGNAVDTTAFSNITGQMVYSAVLDAWDQPTFLADALTTTEPSNILNEEVIPGISNIGDEAEVVDEGHVYPIAGVSEERVITPAKVKRGFIVPVTKEVIIADKTGVLTQRASDVTEQLRINKEKRVLDTCLGITTSYRRNAGSAQATYGDTHTEGTFDNLAASNGLTDYTDIENALLLFDGMTDPNTGDPIIVDAVDVVIPTALKMTSYRVLNSTEVRQGAVSATVPLTLSPSPILQNFTVHSNAYVKDRTSSATTWFIGNFKKAFKYMEAWPITAEQAPANSEAEFTQDIVARYKVSEMGVPAVVEPRYVVKCTA